MPDFEVTESEGWYEADCKELGIGITARDLASVEETARKAARASSSSTPVRVLLRPTAASFLQRVAAFFLPGDGRSRAGKVRRPR
jgi:hypothetical protein